MNIPRQNQPSAGNRAVFNHQQAFLRGPSSYPVPLRCPPVHSGTAEFLAHHHQHHQNQHQTLSSSLPHSLPIVQPNTVGLPFPFSHGSAVQGGSELSAQTGTLANSWPNNFLTTAHIPGSEQKQVYISGASGPAPPPNNSASSSSSSSAAGTPAVADSMNNLSHPQAPPTNPQQITPHPHIHHHPQHPQHVIAGSAQPTGQPSGAIPIPFTQTQTPNGSLPHTPQPNSQQQQPTIGIIQHQPQIMYGTVNPHQMSSGPRLPGHPGAGINPQISMQQYANQFVGQPRGPYNPMPPVTMSQHMAGHPNPQPLNYVPMLVQGSSMQLPVWNPTPGQYAVFQSQQQPAQAFGPRPPMQAAHITYSQPTPTSMVPSTNNAVAHQHPTNVQAATNPMPHQAPAPVASAPAPIPPQTPQQPQSQQMQVQPQQQANSYPQIQQPTASPFYPQANAYYIPTSVGQPTRPASVPQAVPQQQQQQQLPVSAPQTSIIQPTSGVSGHMAAPTMMQPLPLVRFPQYPNQQQPTEKKRNTGGIKIVDPNSGKDITHELLDSKKLPGAMGDSDSASQSSSSRNTPGAQVVLSTPPQNTSIASEFAKQVALAIKKEASENEEVLDLPGSALAPAAPTSVTQSVITVTSTTDATMTVYSSPVTGCPTTASDSVLTLASPVEPLPAVVVEPSLNEPVEKEVNEAKDDKTTKAEDVEISVPIVETKLEDPKPTAKPEVLVVEIVTVEAEVQYDSPPVAQVPFVLEKTPVIPKKEANPNGGVSKKNQKKKKISDKGKELEEKSDLDAFLPPQTEPQIICEDVKQDQTSDSTSNQILVLEETDKQETVKQETDKQETDKQETVKQETVKQETVKQETVKQETDLQKTDKLETDKLETDNQETDNQVTDNQETDNQETDIQETDNQETDNQETDNQETDNQGTDNQETDNQESNKQVTDKLETDKLETNKQETKPPSKESSPIQTKTDPNENAQDEAETKSVEDNFEPPAIESVAPVAIASVAPAQSIVIDVSLNSPIDQIETPPVSVQADKPNDSTSDGLINEDTEDENKLDSNENKISIVEDSGFNDDIEISTNAETLSSSSSAAAMLVKALQPGRQESEELEEGEIVDDDPIDTEVKEKTPELPASVDAEPSSKETTPSDSKEGSVEVTQTDSSKETTPVTPTVTYDDDQWSPSNPGGKRVYDRSFLLNLQFNSLSLTKPEQLPQISDVILEKPRPPVSLPQHPQGPGPVMMGGGGAGIIDFTPSFMPKQPNFGRPMPGMSNHGSLRGEPRGGPRGPPNQPMGRQSQKGERKVISIGRSLQEDVKLKKAENAWKPSSVNRNADSAEAKNEQVFKTVRGILNKLTPQKFAPLVKQILDLDIDSEDRLKGVIDIIFEKAIDEPGFSVAYANMCKHLMLIRVPAPGEKKESTKSEDVYFRKLLLNRCQKEFEAGALLETDFETQFKKIEAIEDEKEKAEAQDNYNIQTAKAKRRYLGNIRFIGELFKLKMLTENIMHDCLYKLLRKKDDKKEKNDEESLECLCRLMSTIGKDLDLDKGKQKIDQYFKEMDKIVKSKKASSRVRFMILDVMELRKNIWVPRRDDNAPKTIDQIHKDAKKEEEEMLATLAANKIKDRERKQQGGGRDGRGGTPNRPVDDGWTTVPSVKSVKIDPSKMKLTKPTAVDESSIQLGPGGRPGGWNRGAGLGGAANRTAEASPAERPSQGPGNRFGPLSGPSDSSNPIGPRQFDNRSTGGRSTPNRDQAWPSQPSLGGSSYQRGGPGSMPPPSAKRAPSGPRDYREDSRRDREHALASARDHTSNFMSSLSQDRRSNSRPNSRPGSREGSRSREGIPSLIAGDRSRGSSPYSGSPTPPPAAPPKAQPSLTAPVIDLEKKVPNILEEYLQVDDASEAIACFKELKCPSKMPFVVELMLNHVLERSPRARIQTGLLCSDLIKASLLTPDDFVTGSGNIFRSVEDLMIDIPQLWNYLGEIFGGLINSNGHFPLKLFKEFCDHLKPLNCSGKFMAAVLKHASNKLGQQTLANCWMNSGLSLRELLSAGEDDKEFVKTNNLEFMVSPMVSPIIPSSSKRPLDMNQLRQELEKRLKRGDDSRETETWIRDTAGENIKDPLFIRTFMTAVISSAVTGESTTGTFKVDFLKKHSSLLKNIYDADIKSETQAIYALQAFVHSLQHPPMMLQKIFDACYDEDIISEDAFHAWHDFPGDDEEGKGVAMKSVVQFFKWLAEAEEVEDESNN